MRTIQEIIKNLDKEKIARAYVNKFEEDGDIEDVALIIFTLTEMSRVRAKKSDTVLIRLPSVDCKQGNVFTIAADILIKCPNEKLVTLTRWDTIFVSWKESMGYKFPECLLSMYGEEIIADVIYELTYLGYSRRNHERHIKRWEKSFEESKKEIRELEGKDREVEVKSLEELNGDITNADSATVFNLSEELKTGIQDNDSKDVKFDDENLRLESEVLKTIKEEVIRDVAQAAEKVQDK